MAFHFKAKNSALKILDRLAPARAYGKSTLLPEILSTLRRVYYHITREDSEELLSSARKFDETFNTYIGDPSYQERDLEALFRIFSIAVEGSPLKSLNREVDQAFENKVSLVSRSIPSFIEKITTDDIETGEFFVNTRVVFGADEKNEFLKSLLFLDKSEKDETLRAVRKWLGDVVELGIDKIEGDPKYRSHEINQEDTLLGIRSITLGKELRILYYTIMSYTATGRSARVKIVRITPTHDYSGRN